MIYAGFWRRFYAGMIDFIVYLPIMIIFLSLESKSKTLTLVLLFPYLLSYYLYNFYFLGRWGKTIGKMAVKIKVVSLDGSPITWRQAFLRNSVDLLFGILTIISSFITYMNIPETDFTGKSWMEFSQITEKNIPKWGYGISFLAMTWSLSELVVLLFNKKRRAIHDFIAGTVVVHEDSLDKVRI